MVGNSWQDKKVIVTGGNGFLGKHLVRLLKENGCNPFIPSSKDYDLRNLDAIYSMLDDSDQYTDVLFHLAANVGGIGYNQNHPYQLFYDNAKMGIELIHTCINKRYSLGVHKLVMIGTTCSYPKWAKPPFNEVTFWDGYPEETNAPYGLAKKMLLVQLQAARKEFSFNGIYLIPTNLYGPGDEFMEYRSHVIPALVKKFVEAKEQGLNQVEVWGSGNATRDFLYVEDAAKAIMLAAEKYDSGAPLNLGSGRSFNIRQLTHLIQKLTGFEGSIKWDTSKPDGQPYRLLDSSAAKHSIGWVAETKLEDGLRKTIEWYKENIYAKN